MKLKDALAYCLYPIYNWLAIHDAPIFILDLFLPILTTTTWEELLEKEIEGTKIYDSAEELLEDLHTAWNTYNFTFCNTCSHGMSYIELNFSSTSDNNSWYYITSDSS